MKKLLALLLMVVMSVTLLAGCGTDPIQADVPVVGAIILLVFSLKPGTIGANNYGADPKDTYIG